MNPLMIFLAIASYFFGAIPIGVLVCRAQGVDIMNFGSRNPGATNVGRALGKKWFFIVFALDVLKGVLPALAARAFYEGPMDIQVVAFALGGMAILGHCLSPFLGFRGGKGVATGFGAALGATPLIAIAAITVFLIIFAISRIISLASILASLSAVAASVLIPGQASLLLPVYVALAGFVVFRHRANIGRLLRGEEPKYRPSEKSVDAVNSEAAGARPQ